jgi:hypothetical protein
MPVTGAGKIDKKPLRRDGWRCTEDVWWQPARGEPYRRLTPADVADLRTLAADHGRESLVDPAAP